MPRVGMVAPEPTHNVWDMSIPDSLGIWLHTEPRGNIFTCQLTTWANLIYQGKCMVAMLGDDIGLSLYNTMISALSTSRVVYQLLLWMVFQQSMRLGMWGLDTINSKMNIIFVLWIPFTTQLFCPWILFALLEDILIQYYCTFIQIKANLSLQSHHAKDTESVKSWG